MNRAASTPKAYTLYLNMTATTATGVRLNIDAASDTSYQDIIQGKATQLLVFKGGKIIKTNYTSVDFDNGKPPVESVVLIAQNVPAEPTALKSTTVSYKSILLEWTPSPTDTITGYLIERKMAGGTVFEPVAMVNNTSNSYTDIGLKDTTAYTYRIMAFNTAGKSGYSSESSATTLKVYRKAYNPPHTIPGKIQAEDYDNNDDGIGYHDADPNNQGSSYRLDQGVDVQKCTDTNGGFNVAYIANGEWLTFSLDSIKTGKYDINLRVASAQAGTNKVKFYLGDKLLGYVQPVSTGGWQTWQTLSLKNISISETDTHLLKLVFEGSNFNINWIEFVQIQSPTGFNQIETDNGFAKIFPNPTSDNIQIEISKTCLTADYVISDVLGNIQKTGVVKNGSNQVDISGLKNGIYLIRIKQNALGTMTQNIIKI